MNVLCKERVYGVGVGEEGGRGGEDEDGEGEVWERGEEGETLCEIDFRVETLGLNLFLGLRHLDLSGNKIVSLPLGFGALENLRWLDLKDNPLEPHLAAVAGDCLDKKQCTNAAKQVIIHFTK